MVVSLVIDRFDTLFPRVFLQVSVLVRGFRERSANPIYNYDVVHSEDLQELDKEASEARSLMIQWLTEPHA